VDVVRASGASDGGDQHVSDKLRSAFLALVLVQAVHSIEEYAFKFYEVFPPARWLDGRIPGIARPGFIIFNIVLVGFGFACFAHWVRPARRGVCGVVWLWIAIEAYNGLAHVAWATIIGGYNPGLITAPVLLGLAAYMALQMRRPGFC
jgi:hypothetical protein